MLDVLYRKATLDDIDVLTGFRIRFLNDYKGHVADEETEILRKNIRKYFLEAIPKEEFVAFIAEINGEVIASSGMEIREVTPRYGPLLNGRMGYIMNMYTVPGLRRRGIASRLLELLEKEASKRGVGLLHLHASMDGSGIYRKAGFIDAELPEMVLPVEKSTKP